MFLPTLALTAAYTGFVDHAYNLALSEALRPNDMAAAYLLAAFAGPTIRAITAAAAIVTHTEKHHVSFSALINKALRGGLRPAPPRRPPMATSCGWQGGSAAVLRWDS